MQLPLFFLGTGLAVILVLSGAIYFFAANLLMDETVSKTHELMELSGTNLSTYIAHVKGESNVFASDPTLRQYLSGNDESLRDGLLSRINVLLENDSAIKSVVVVSKDGRILSNEEGLDMSVSEDMMKEDWYMESIHNTMPVLTGARMQSFSSDKDNWVISISTEIIDAAGENLGVLLMDMPYSVVEDHLSSLDLGTGGYVFLLNDKGEPVYHKDTSYFSEPNKQKLLKEEVIGDGFDMIIVRELTGGLYFGERKTVEENGVTTAVDTLTYNENEIRRIAVKAFDIAMKRNKKVTSVDKANVLDSSRLWRKVVEEVAKDYPEVTLEHMLVDNCAMQLVHNPGQFDVILTENMFGDILSDEASMVTGSIGMLSSASLNETKFGLYEPSHGSAPDIAGKGIANPLATILSAAMMLRYSLDLDKEADAVEAAVQKVLTEGFRTVDIMADGMKQVGTIEMGDLIAERI